MTLLNGWMALGSLAFVIPMAIHLWYRTRFRTIAWGAMHLLETKSLTHPRRIQWHQFLLLVLRCLVPILLALAMARPFLPEWSGSSNGTPRSIVIAIDDSMSMFAVDGFGKFQKTTTDSPMNRFELACSMAKDLLKQLPSGSEAKLLLAGANPQFFDSNQPHMLQQILEELPRSKQPAGVFNYQEAIVLAESWLSTRSNTDRRLHLLTDLEASDWSDALKPNSSTFDKEQLRQSGIAFSIGNVGPQSQQVERNYFVKSLTCVPRHLCPGVEASLQIELGLHGGERESHPVTISTSINDVEIDRRDLNLSTDSTLQLPWMPMHAGSYRITTECLVDDTLQFDNSLSVIKEVVSPLSVLLIHPSATGDDANANTFLQLALAPFAVEGATTQNKFMVHSIPLSKWAESVQEPSDVVILCGVSELPVEMERSLHRFVSQGKGLIVIPASNPHLESLQNWKGWRDGGIRIANIEGCQEIATFDQSSQHLNTREIPFETLRTLSNVSRDSIGSANFKTRLQVTTLDQQQVNVAMRWNDGEPWLLESKIGDGRCMWLLSSLDTSNSNLTSKPAFVPLVQRLTAHAADVGQSGSTLTPGATWEFSLPESVDAVWVEKPDKSTDKVPCGQGRFRYTNTRLVGDYFIRRIETNQGDPADENRVTSRPNSDVFPGRLAAVWNTARESESRLTPLASTQLAELPLSLGVPILADLSHLEIKKDQNPNGREIWTWFVSLLLGCLFFEMLLASWIPSARHRSVALAQSFSQAEMRR